ncbi:MAP kinase-activated kinase 2 isoform X1 [Brachionus plicatilis]|uniref:MAP kinase-activated kinase 2 isoform X1 n=1 Tax=Brachionus plicatilis TaxID=10195 RepID=A0A3M7SEV5_BRAPC|nr:MAP kinase-activated kinase 2 isoform X1 [Brachionus plicatilis]
MNKSSTLYDESIFSIKSKFKKLGVLGYGLNGGVFLAKSKKDKKFYAIKPFEKNEKSKNEINLHWECLGSCTNIVDIHALHSTNKNFYLILEYMEGGSLWDKIKNDDKNFSEKDIVNIMRQICAAVNVLHSKGIAHRDIKLENILCSGQNLIVKLAEFNFAKQEKLGLKSSKFTAPYVAPEVLCEPSYSISCDIWSLGVLMFILCCGYLPFSSSTESDFSKGMIERIISEDLDLIVNLVDN